MASHLLSILILAAPALAQVAVWGQCGGNGWTGGTTCTSGNYCKYSNDWYSQCIPGNAAVTTSSTSIYTPPVTSVPPPSSSSVPVSSGTSTSSTPTTSNPPTTCPAFSNPTSATTPKLPDPFTFVSGTKVTTKSAWNCRRSEISQQLQLNEFGLKPPKPSSVTGSLSGNTLTINVSEGGKSISFSVSITYPSSGTAPFPAIIGYGGGSIPTPAGVASINFNNDDIAAQTNTGSRGQGKFYTLYGSGHSAGALIAWAWGVSRIVDAIKTTANIRINSKKIGVTGCSRNGKGAIVAGAFDDRIALTIPQESGSGGAACWRLSDSQKSSGQNVQTASQIITENVWFSKSFDPFVNAVPRLPADHHELAGMVAPRGLYVIENTSQEWLGNLACYGCMKAGQSIYTALGVQANFGFSQVGNHNHCAFPSSQQSELTAFVRKFLFDESTNTNIFKTDGSFTFDSANWMPWTIPTLS